MSSDNYIRVVYIMDEAPSYDLYKKSGRPTVNWEVGEGKWIGIWGYDWGNVLGEYVVKNDTDFSFEVRQPDFRANEVYEHSFGDRISHRLYPAQYDAASRSVVSESLIEDLVDKENRNTIIHTSIGGKFLSGITGRIKKGVKVGSFHGEITLPIDNFFRLRKNVLNYARKITEQREFRKTINEYDVITYQSERGLKKLKKYYKGRLETATMGIDFEKFRLLDKAACRKELGLPPDKKILLNVGRINSNKRQAELIELMNSLEPDFDFVLVIIGHGLEEEEESLKKVSGALLEKGKIIFTGYIRGEKLVKYYNSADVFLMTSFSEAGPVSSMEAIACDVPIITTDTGAVCDYLKGDNSGVVVPRNDFQKFEAEVKSFLEGKRIKTADREKAKERYDWNVVARRFIDIYRSALRGYKY